jgi:hypothetical protein
MKKSFSLLRFSAVLLCAVFPTLSATPASNSATAPTSKFKILDPQGNSASGAKIALGTFRIEENLRSEWTETSEPLPLLKHYRDVDYKNGDFPKYSIPLFDKLESDADGVFTVPQNKEKYRLVISHPAGWARVYSRELEAGKPIKLAPWGKIRGKFLLGEKPNADKEINAIQRITNSLRISSSAIIDKDGNFELNYLFPRMTTVYDKRREKRVFVESGKTTEIDFSPEGRPVSGKLLDAENENIDLFFVDLYREEDLAKQSLPVASTETEKRETVLTEEMQELETLPSNFPSPKSEVWSRYSRVEKDGSFRLVDVPAGKYILTFGMPYIFFKTQRKIEVTLSEGKIFIEEPQDLGTFDLEAEIKAAKKKNDEIKTTAILGKRH